MFLGSTPVWNFTGRAGAGESASWMPLRQPMPVLFVGEPIVLGFAPIEGKPAPQLAGADSRDFAKGVALSGSMRPLSGNGHWRHWHDPEKRRDNPRSHNHHHRPAAGAQDRRSFLEPCHCLTRGELQHQVQQGDQALAVGMKKAEVARAPKPRRNPLGSTCCNTSHRKWAPDTVLRSVLPVLALR